MTTDPYDRTPPTVHRRPPAPPSKPEVPPAPRPAVAGLDPEQEIRARALDAAVRLDGETTSLEPSLTAYVESGGLAELIDMADVLAGWIRTEARP